MTEFSKRQVITDNYFALIPEWVLYSPITSHAKVVYCVLSRHADSDGYCFPSRARMADKLGLNVKMIDRAMSELKDMGAVRVKRRKRDDGSWSSNLYKVFRNGPAPVSIDEQEDDAHDPNFGVGVGSQMSIGRDTDVTRGRVSDVQQSKASINQSQEVNNSPSVSDETSFDEFWKIYPRKVNKGQARRVWNKVIKQTDPVLILEAAQRYAQQRTGQDSQFTAHASTWLNGERWTDEPDPTFDKPGQAKARAIAEALERMNRKEIGA